MPVPSAAPASLTVVVGAPTVSSALPEAPALVVVEADLERARQLKQELDDGQVVMVCAEVLTAEDGAAMRWHTFNDGRLNGPLGLEQWQRQLPNLQLVGVQERQGRRLQDVLTHWAQVQGLQQQIPLEVVLRQGDPIAALAGLGQWENALQQVSLEIPRATAEWTSGVDDWLSQQGFRRSEGSTTRWVRDPIATMQRILTSKEQRIAELEEQLSTQAVRLLLAQSRHEELITEHDQRTAERDALIAGRDGLLAERNGLAAERDSLFAERDQRTAERDQLQAERNQLQAERDGLIAERDGLAAERDSLFAERDQRTAERDQLQAERNQLQAERDALIPERDGLVAERDALVMRRDELEARMERINSELDDILSLIDSTDPSTTEENATTEAPNP